MPAMPQALGYDPDKEFVEERRKKAINIRILAAWSRVCEEHSKPPTCPRLKTWFDELIADEQLNRVASSGVMVAGTGQWDQSGSVGMVSHWPLKHDSLLLASCISA